MLEREAHDAGFTSCGAAAAFKWSTAALLPAREAQVGCCFRSQVCSCLYCSSSRLSNGGFRVASCTSCTSARRPRRLDMHSDGREEGAIFVKACHTSHRTILRQLQEKLLPSGVTAHHYCRLLQYTNAVTAHLTVAENVAISRCSARGCSDHPAVPSTGRMA